MLCGAEAERGLWTSEGLPDFSELPLILVCTRGTTSVLLLLADLHHQRRDL